MTIEGLIKKIAELKARKEKLERFLQTHKQVPAIPFVVGVKNKEYIAFTDARDKEILVDFIQEELMEVDKDLTALLAKQAAVEELLR